MNAGLEGDLKDFSISDIVQLNCVEKKSSQVTIDTRGGQAVIFFAEGNIVHACYNDLKGEQALYKILRINEGKFRVYKESNIPARTIHTSLDGLLLEGMRVIDEASRDEESILSDLGNELKNFSGIQSVILFSNDGNQILPPKDEDRIRDYAAARLINQKAGELLKCIHFSDMRFTGIVVGKRQIFITKCLNLFLIITADRNFDFAAVETAIEALCSKFKHRAVETESESDLGG